MSDLQWIILPIFELPSVVVERYASRMLHATHDVHDVVLVDQHC